VPLLPVLLYLLLAFRAPMSPPRTCGCIDFCCVLYLCTGVLLSWDGKSNAAGLNSCMPYIRLSHHVTATNTQATYAVLWRAAAADAVPGCLRGRPSAAHLLLADWCMLVSEPLRSVLNQVWSVMRLQLRLLATVHTVSAAARAITASVERHNVNPCLVLRTSPVMLYTQIQPLLPGLACCGFLFRAVRPARTYQAVAQTRPDSERSYAPRKLVTRAHPWDHADMQNCGGLSSFRRLAWTGA